MKMIDFPGERVCPLCRTKFGQARLEEEYAPVVVITCPHCSGLLWRPGLDENAALHPFEAGADPDSF